jgi:hypothetical protein
VLTTALLAFFGLRRFRLACLIESLERLGGNEERFGRSIPELAFNGIVETSS